MAVDRGGGAEGYRRYTLAELVAMGFADSPADAEANRVQWRKLGDLLVGAAESATKAAEKLPDSYRSREGAPALLDRLGRASKQMQTYGQVALDNGTAWLAVKQSLEDAQATLAGVERVGAAGLPVSARDAAADVIEKLSSEYINHANEILAPETAEGDKHGELGPVDNGYVRREIYSPGPGGDAPGTHTQSGDSYRGGVPPTTGVPGPGPSSPGRTTAPYGPGPAAGPGTAGTQADPRTAGAIGVPRAGGDASYAPVGRTLGGRLTGGTGGPGVGTGADLARTGGRPATPSPGVPAGGSPGVPPGGQRDGRGRRRPGRRRGGLLGDPNDFRYQPDVVAPPEIRPDEERPLGTVGRTIGGAQKPTQPEAVGMPEPAGGREAPRSSPAPEPDVSLDEGGAVFRLRRRGAG